MQPSFAMPDNGTECAGMPWNETGGSAKDRETTEEIIVGYLLQIRLKWAHRSCLSGSRFFEKGHVPRRRARRRASSLKERHLQVIKSDERIDFNLIERYLI